jgi:hypothetical protein
MEKESTPMQRMIEWIESGCSTSGENWERFKETMLKSEELYTLCESEKATINYLQSISYDN